MKAVYYDEFKSRPIVRTLPDPTPPEAGAVIRVEATGICRSDWHGWMGHDPDIVLPHVPGHEFAGVVATVGRDVTRWREGDRVTVPFVCGCGRCPQCVSGNHQVCDRQFQPGFTGWGSFAEYVAVDHADVNLVRLPEDLSFLTAASLGCRFSTSFRAVAAQGRLSAGQWLAVHGCGGVGLSAVMIGRSLGANVIAIDIAEDKLDLAREVGAVAVVNGLREDVVQAVQDLSGGGVHVSIDALGHPSTCYNSITSLRKRGRHVQVGLMLEEHSTPKVPMSRVIGHELEILGSHGMQAHEFDRLLDMILSGLLDPRKLIDRTISLDEAVEVLVDMDSFAGRGITIVDKFQRATRT